MLIHPNVKLGYIFQFGTEKVNSPIPQLDGIFDDKLRDDKAHFELKVEAHEKCTNSDVIEALQENFLEHLIIRKLGKQYKIIITCCER